MLNMLRAGLDEHHTNGKVAFEYDSAVYYGLPSA